MGLSRRDHPDLIRIDVLQAQGKLDAAIDAIDAAQSAGHERSIHGLPLDFVRRDIEARRQFSDKREAAEILDEAGLALQAGDLNRVHALYAKALRLPYIDTATRNLILANVELLETRSPNYAHSQGAFLASGAQLDGLSADLFQTIELKRPNMARFLRLCAAPRWLTGPIIDVMRGKEDGRGDELLKRLAPYSFVYEGDRGRYTLSAEARRFYLAKWADDPDGYRGINANLTAYFTEWLATNPPRNPADYQQLVQAQLYHTFLADPDEGVELLVQTFQKAEDEYQRVAARQYIIVLQELEGQIPPEYYAYIEYGEGWFHHIDGNTHAARLLFNELALRTDLHPDLAARVQRGLGAVRARDGQWVESLASYQHALDAFKTMGKDDEVAKTMAGLGNANLDMAIGAAGSPMPFTSDHLSNRGLLSIGALLVRLPLIVYLLWKLEFHLWPLPNLFKLGEGVDWTIARLYSDAILWFRRAEALFKQEGNAPGLYRVRAHLGRLYLALHYPRTAIDVLEPLVAETEPGTLPHARAQLSYADALAQLGQLEQATKRWREALSVFTALAHKYGAAQSRSRLGYSAQERGDIDCATDEFDAALTAWQELEEPVRATVILDAMEDATADDPESESIQAKVHHARARLPVRTYAVRYLNPQLGRFQRVSIYIFAVLFGLTLLVGLEVQPQFTPDTEIVFSEIETPYTVTALALTAEIKQGVKVTVRPDLPVLIALSIIIIGAYMALYTLIGIWLLNSAPISKIQQVQRFRILIDDEGITRVGSTRAHRLSWESITHVIFSKRSLCVSYIDLLSDILVQSNDAYLEVDGLTRQFTRIGQRLTQRCSGRARFIDLSVSFLCGGWGYMLLGSLLLQVLFILVASMERNNDFLITPHDLLHPYALINLYNLLDLGIALPLLYWLVIQPIRYRLHRRPTLGNLWILLCLAALSCVLAFAPLYLERPSIMPSITAIILSSAVLRNYWRFFRSPQLKKPRDDEAESSSLQLAVRAFILAAAVAILVASTVAIWREMQAFHHFARGDASLVIAEKTLDGEREQWAKAREQLDRANEDLEHAQELYAAAAAKAEDGDTIIDDKARQNESLDTVQLLRDLQEDESAQLEAKQVYADAEERYRAVLYDAIAAYEDSWTHKQDPDLHTRIGTAASKTGDFDVAEEKFEAALGEGTIEARLNIANAFATAAFSAVDVAYKIEYYDLARAEYDTFLDNSQLSNAVTKGKVATQRYRDAHRSKAGVLFNLFFLQKEEVDRDHLLEEAYTTYEELEVHTVRRPRFWRLRQLLSRQPLEIPTANFQDANLGRGWAHYYLSIEAEGKKKRDHLTAAIGNFTAAQEGDKDLNRVAYHGRAWSYIEMSKHVGGECAGELPGHGFVEALNEENLELAIEDVSKALASVDRENGFLLKLRAELKYILSGCGDESDRAAEHQQAIDDYQLAIQTDHPDKGEWRRRLGDIHREVAAEEFLESARRSQLTKASEAYLAAIAADTSDVEAYDALREVYEELGRTDEQALEDILAGTDLEDDDETLIKLARAELARNTYGLARAAMLRVRDRHESNDEAANGEAEKLLGQIMFAWANRYESPVRFQRYQEAIEAATRAAHSEIDDAEVYALLGRAHLALNNTEAAIALLELARARDANDPEIQFDLGNAYLHQKEVDDAFAQYKSAIESVVHTDVLTATAASRNHLLTNALGDVLTVPLDTAESNFELAALLTDAILADGGSEFATAEEYFYMGQIATANKIRGRKENHARAVSYYFRAVAQEPLNPRYSTRLRTALILGLGMGQVESGEAALTIISGAADLYGVDSLVELAKSELDKNLFGLAASALEWALILEPSNEEIYTLLTKAYYRWGYRYRRYPSTVELRSQLAVDTFARAAAAGIESGDLHLYRSGGLLGVGDYSGGKTALRRALKLGVTDADVLWTYGWWAYELEAYELSVMASQQAAELSPNRPLLYFNEGLARVALGETLAARDVYQAGINVANALDNPALRIATIEEAIGDLKKIKADPADNAAEFITRLEAALADDAP